MPLFYKKCLSEKLICNFFNSRDAYVISGIRKVGSNELFPEVEIHPGLKGITYEMLLAHGTGLERDPEIETYIELAKLEILGKRD